MPHSVPCLIRAVAHVAVFLLAAAPAPAGSGTAARVARTPDGPATVLLLRTRRQYQRIDNFGASGAWTMDHVGSEWSVANRARIADLLFSTDRGIGLSCWRFNVGAGGAWTDQLWDPWRGAECFRRSPDAPYDWSRQAGQQWFMRAARDRGVRQFVACVYSPPTWLTRNGHAYGDKGGTSTNLKPGCEKPFARFLADVLAHFRQAGLPFTSTSPANEPNWDWTGGQEGCRYSRDDLVRVVRALSTELAARHLSVEIDVPEAGDVPSMLDADILREWAGQPTGTGARPGPTDETVRTFLGGPDLRRMTSGKVVGHSYWADSGTRRLRDLRLALRRTIDRYDVGARYWQSEYCVMEHKRDLGMDTALRVARVIHYDMTAADASAWHWWLAVSTADYKDGLIYTDYRQTGQQNVVPSKTLWALGNFSRYVRPGMRRVAVEPGESDGLYSSAYLDDGSGRLVVVIVNERAEDRRVLMDADTTLSRVTPHVTSASDDLAARPAVSPDGAILIPARSVVTLTMSTAGRPRLQRPDTWQQTRRHRHFFRIYTAGRMR